MNNTNLAREADEKTYLYHNTTLVVLFSNDRLHPKKMEMTFRVSPSSLSIGL